MWGLCGVALALACWCMRNPTNINVLTRAKAFQLSVHESPFRQRARAIPGLSAELSRSIGSIVWNIAEGAAFDDPAFARHLLTAIGSANEAEQQLILAHDRKLLGSRGDWYVREIVEIRKMTIGLRKTVVRRIAAGAPSTDAEVRVGRTAEQ